jgi:sulfite exporter TauE/SafE
MTTYYLTAALLGLGGGLHCLGMCGPLAAAVAGFTPRDRFWVLQTVYHVGRMAAYALMGAATAALGRAFFPDWAMEGLSVAAGALMLSTLFWKKSFVSSKFLARAVGYASRRTGMTAYGAMGLANGFLPCGLSYTAAFGAAAAGGAAAGAGYMLIFGLCTAPALIGAGFLLRRFPRRPALTRGVVMVAALLLIIRGLNLGIPGLSPKIQHGKVECCEKKTNK